MLRQGVFLNVKIFLLLAILLTLFTGCTGTGTDFYPTITSDFASKAKNEIVPENEEVTLPDPYQSQQHGRQGMLRPYGVLCV